MAPAGPARIGDALGNSLGAHGVPSTSRAPRSRRTQILGFRRAHASPRRPSPAPLMRSRMPARMGPVARWPRVSRVRAV
eukprot:3949047-Prymnesium_polylepis.2